MISELGKRRAEIMSFLSELSARERLIVLSYLANDSVISARIPDLARTVLHVHRAHHRVELLKLATENSNIDLEFLARRKGCNIEPVEGLGNRWRIISAASDGARLGVGGSRTPPTSLTQKQALDLLRALPDQQRKA